MGWSKPDPVAVTSPPAGAALDSSLATIAADIALQAKLADTQPVSGTVGVSNFPATQPVSGAFYPATQPVSAVSLPLPAGAALDSSLATIAADIALQAKLTDTQPVLVSNFPATQAVAGTFFQATQPVSGAVVLTGEALEAMRTQRQRLGYAVLHPRSGLLTRKHLHA